MQIRLAATIVTAALALGAVVAHAAARFDHSSPGPEAVLSASPGRVEIYTRRATSADPADTQVIVVDGDKRRVDWGDSAVDPADHQHITVSLEPGLASGRYIVSFKTRGENDLDHDGGQYAFYVGMQPSAADLAADKSLTLTTLGGEDVLTGYRRGLVEGALGVAVALPVVLYLVHRHYRRRGGDPLAELRDS